jgi:hypothetical protein
VTLQRLIFAYDKGNFYQVRASQWMVESQKGRLKKWTNQIETIYTSDVATQERNTEHYGDELIACSEKIFESIGLIQVSFPANAILNEKIASVQAMLTTTDDILPTERVKARILRFWTTENAEQAIKDQEKEQIPYVQKWMEPLTNLLNYLQTQINTDSR